MIACYGVSGQTFGGIRGKNNAGTQGDIKRTNDALKVADSTALVQITKAADSAYHRVMFKISQLPIISIDSSTTRNTVKVSQLPSIALGANSGVDIGDVTINNASGGSAVNIQDGGNSITVDANALPLPSGASTEASLSAVRTATELIDDAVNTVGSAVTAKAIGVSGTDGTNARLLSVSSTGLLRIDSNYTRVNQSSGGGGTQYAETATTSPATGTLMMGRYRASPPTLNNSELYGLQLDAGGNLKVTGSFTATQGPTVIYDSSVTATSMTITALNSLANSATAGWKSDTLDLRSRKCSDIKFGIKITMANTAPANDKAVYVYAIPWWYDGSAWYSASGGTTTLPTGGQAAYTIASPNNFRLLGVLSYTTQNMVLQDQFLLSNAFGNVMPDMVQLFVLDYSGAAVHSSGNALYYSPIYKTQR
jgi:hypothetical protein